MIDLMKKIIKNSKMYNEFEVNGWQFFSYMFFAPEEYLQIRKKYGFVADEMRGFQYNPKTNQMIYSMPKFFNFNEIEFTKEKNIVRVLNVYEKVDGSLIKIWKNKETEEIEIATKNGFPELFINKCREIINRKPQLRNFIENYLNQNPLHTLLFELVSEINKIVVEYDEEDLILLMIRDEKGRMYFEQPEGVSVPKTYNYDLKTLKEKQKTEIKVEGWVALCETKDGARLIKFKTEWYLKRHKLYQLSKKDIFKMIQEETIDDLYSYMPEHSKQQVNEMISVTNHLIDKIYEEFKELGLNTITKKDINLLKEIPKNKKGIFIRIWSEDLNEIKNNIKEFLKKIPYKRFLQLLETFKIEKSEIKINPNDYITGDYIVYGFKKSIDLDIAFLVKNPEILNDKNFCHRLSEKIKEQYQDRFEKEMNINLIYVKDGKVLVTYKGYNVEVNNSILFTWKNHKENKKEIITERMVYDIKEKMRKVCNAMIMYIKDRDFRVKNTMLNEFDLDKAYKIRGYVKSDEYKKWLSKTNNEVKKIIAFQLAQFLSLTKFRGEEKYVFNDKFMYDKEMLGVNFPWLKPYLDREFTNSDELYKTCLYFFEIFEKIV